MLQLELLIVNLLNWIKPNVFYVPVGPQIVLYENLWDIVCAM